MNKTFFCILFLIITSYIASVFAQDLPDATEIIRRADAHIRGNTSIAEMTMQVVKLDWSREISMKAWSKGDKFGLILITAPARDKGTTFLLRDKEVWNWVPTIERVIKMPPSMMLQSWMGSDFTNDDLVKESSTVKDYTHKLTGDSTVGGRECYVIELIPKPDAAVVWGKVRTWITKKDYLQLRGEFFDEDGALVNIMVLSDIKMMGGRLLPTRFEMIPVDKPKQKTVLIYNSLIFDQPIEDGFFSEQNMKRVR
ncbi:MAG: outer membrane lipoprotein-sorting protein [Calditrichaeota bacterium]|nr:outer membrane lipoprotein-sorting protein [Calditrichota bacterium]